MLSEIWDAAAAHVPTVALALIVLLLGVLGAVLLGRAATWFVRRSRLEKFFGTIGGEELLQRVGYAGSLSELTGVLARWLAILATGLVAADIAGLTLVASALASIVAYAPRMIVAGITFVVVLWLASLLRTMVTKAGSRKDEEVSGRVIGEIAYYVVVAVGFAVGAAQLGMDTRLVNSLILAVAGAASLGLALSFALAARRTFSDVIAQHYARRAYLAGDHLHLRNDGIRGVVVGYRGNAVILRSEGEDIYVPCDQLMSQPVGVLPPDAPVPREDSA